MIPPEEEVEVIERLKAGDRQALATLFSWYGDQLFRCIILPRLPNQEAAEDILKETFRLAMERIDQYEHGPYRFFAWLRRIAINQVFDHHRRSTRQDRAYKAVAAEPPSTSFAPPDKAIDLAETRSLIERSLSKINPRYATALRLRLLEDRSRPECAEALGITVPQFDVVLHRACLAFRGAYPP